VSWLALICSLAALTLGLAALILARRTAQSTREAVAEVKEASLLAMRPALSLTPTSTAWSVDWDRAKTEFPTLSAGGGMDSADGIFRLVNAAPAPAFEIEIDWTLDPGAQLAPGFHSTAIDLAVDQQTVDVTYADNAVQLRDRDWRSALRDYDYRHALSDRRVFVELAGNARRYLSPAEEVEHRIVLLALEAFESWQIRTEGSEPRKLELSIAVRCMSLAKETTSQTQRLSIEIGRGYVRGPDKRIVADGLPADWTTIEITLKVTAEGDAPE
jgi:hypothetical protein